MDKTVFLNQTLNDYCVLQSIGEGAFSFVYEAVHKTTNTHVAMKILRPGATLDQQREFDNEGDLLVKLSGARRVVNILDSQTAQIAVTMGGNVAPIAIPVRFHVLELAAGCLDELVANIDLIPWDERLRLYRDVVLGVHQMHLQKVMHRDLKSANCLLFDENFHSLIVKVNDLGRSRDIGEAAIGAAWVYRMGRGDPNFWPPEMLWHLGSDAPNCHRPADLYGLGCVLFELIAGQAITAVAVYPRATIVQNDLKLPDDIRRQQYNARADEIRSWYEGPFLLAAHGLPPEIRDETLRLLRQLCDPMPFARFPKVRTNRRTTVTDNLNWLLRRIDILQLTLKHAAHQRQQQINKKAVC